MGESEVYDLIIVGGGPAGLSSAIYAGRSELKTLVIEKGSYGGRIKETENIMNYPGNPDLSGQELINKFKKHAELFSSIKWLRTTVNDISKEDGKIKMDTKRRGSFTGKSAILSVGTEPRVLEIPGEKEFTGRGVAYCGTCDAKNFENEHVYVLGSGDQAIEEAQYISKFASKVTIIVLHEEGELDCNKMAAEEAYNNDKINFIWNSTIAEIKGDNHVKSVVIKNVKTGELTEYPTPGVFFFVGVDPLTDFVDDFVECDKRGFIKVNKKQKTSVEGVYAVGDCTDSYLRQVVTSAGDGAVAAVASERYIENKDRLNSLLEDKDEKIAFIFYSPYDDQAIDKVNELEENYNDEMKVVLQDISRKKVLYNRLDLESNFALAFYEDGEFNDIIDLSVEKNWQECINS